MDCVQIEIVEERQIDFDLLMQEMIRDEGVKYHAYRDPTGNWAIGVGHLTGKPVKSITKQQALNLLQDDLNTVCDGLDAHLPWWRQLKKKRQHVLINMGFNLGVGGLLRFKKMLHAVKTGKFKIASRQMLIAKWARQVKDRARRLAVLMN